MSNNKQNQKITIPREEYRKLKKEHEKLRKLLERIGQNEKPTRKATNRLLDKLEEGYNLGKLNYNERSELHERQV